ncbi:ELMO domain-containing protein 1-like [Lethenteron reissneri]|uniref:ELMO domain-containing protein 1-like n=1 Tax=Lethenteron reissneri TaxID=7753 RepID=UPI002AB61D6D|nr:ELMO domain-containing protein 1-like [Lethenteron reissneri]XP_061408182.1 ELMO domain-containing protein 1-like [Lethenteron reissneri]XP_061408183.1 ELMO domain-containing protein 1-like [Lethenteron reissneri]XP_061408184.1 ELMO domain-containing protein 1-like [Lethenteron reissneri]
MLWRLWLFLYGGFLRGWIKWFFRQLSGRCELQRICYRHKTGATRALAIEYSLTASKNVVLCSAVKVSEPEVEKTAEEIMHVKKINPSTNPTFAPVLQACLLQISGYHALTKEVEEIRKQRYDSENKTHEEALLKLWALLMPEVTLKARITKQWGDIGFQGDDPSTDFRGMGMLGLLNLLYFAEEHTTAARQVLSHSHHPKYGFSYAIVGINITELAYTLLFAGAMKSHFYNIIPAAPRLVHFHQAFCYLFHEFDAFWLKEEPRDIMEFNRVRELFRQQVQDQLSSDEAVLVPRFDSTPASVPT